MPTYTPKAGDTTREWYVIDATDVVLGRLAVAAANLLRGKHKPTFTPNTDGGDFVIVINAEKVALSGNKLTNKFAYRHSGYPGGLRRRSVGELLEKHPTRVVENAIVGMLPHTKLGRQIQEKLKVYAGATHGVLSGPAIDRINESVLRKVWVTNTIPQQDKQARCDKLEVLSIANLVGEAIKRIHHGDSISSLFE